MLKKIKSMFGKQSEGAVATSANSNFIIDKAQIISLLSAAAHQRLVCNLELSQAGAAGAETNKEAPSSAEDAETEATAGAPPPPTQVIKFHTYMYRVGAERAALEKLVHLEQHVKLMAAEQIKVFIDMHGTPLTFQISIKSIQSEGDKEFYIIDLPEKVYYPLDRENRRIKVTGTKIPVYLKFPSIDKTLPSMVDDIGLTGMSLILSTKGVNLPTIKRRDVFKSCGINCSFGNGSFDLEVKEAKEFEGKSIIRLNCTFIDLSKDMKNIVDSIIGSLEQVSFIKPKK